ncbi:MAG: TIGR03435 family protein [Acidobacteriia bacterium]|nr:TIGR03435 family protein [Terriglobia bacterium]
MNNMQLLVSQPWVERLGMTLLHFLWQGLFIAILYAAARRSVARTSSLQTRYLLACGALAAMMAAPLVTWELMAPSDASPEAIYRIRSTPQAASSTGIATTTTLPDSVRAAVSSAPSERFLFWVVMVWLAGAMVFWVRLAGGWVVAARMRSMLVRRAPPEWQETLRKLGAQIGLSRPVRLLVSALVQAPAVVGWLRPVVLVPVGALGGLPAEHLEALLLHELAHIRRHDYLINILQSVAESLLFYHPAVWWVSGHIRAEREQCCDDVAVSISGDAITYARALAQLESYRPAHLGALVAANGGSLANRIARLLGRQRPAVRTGPEPGVITVAGLLVVAAYGLFGQSADPPRFAVASIKRSPSTVPLSMAVPMGVGYRPGGRLTAGNAPLTMLIQRAYSVQGFQVVGGPSWISTEGYDIEAKPEGNTDQKRMWLMLQTLLADRFKLSMHRETRDLPVYDLQAVKSGPKLPAPQGGACAEVLTTLPEAGQPRPAPPCGPGLVKAGTGLTMLGFSVSMPAFAKQLSLIVGREVIDKTGFTGRFSLHLEFAIDDALAGLPDPVGPDASGQPADPAARPTIRTALQEQLGLKLEVSKGPVDVLVIDHVERPTEN